MKFSKYIFVGLKALAGAIVTAILVWFYIGVVSILFMKSPLLLSISFLALLVINVYLLGLIYNKFWDWD